MRDYFTILIGSLDLEEIHERANSGTNHGFALLREALILGCVRVRGLSLDEPEGVLGNLEPSERSTPQLEHALIASTRSEVTQALQRRRCTVHHRASDLLGSRSFRDLLRSNVWSFATGDERIRLWREVLEPFTRCRTINIFEPYIFRSLVEPDCLVEQTGLYWLLHHLQEECHRDPLRKSINVRGTFREPSGRMDEAIREQAKTVVRHCEALAERFGANLELKLEVVDRSTVRAERGPAHDRFWIGRNGNNAARVMFHSTSVIQQANRPRVKTPFNITITQERTSLHIYSKEWSDLGKFIFQPDTRGRLRGA